MIQVWECRCRLALYTLLGFLSRSGFRALCPKRSNQHEVKGTSMGDHGGGGRIPENLSEVLVMGPTMDGSSPCLGELLEGSYQRGTLHKPDIPGIEPQTRPLRKTTKRSVNPVISSSYVP